LVARIPLYLRAALILVLSSAALGEGNTVVVHMTVQKKFDPAKITIKAGDTVKWVADDPLHEHNISTDPRQVENRRLVLIPKGAKPFTSPLLSEGQSFQYRFTVPGLYKYVCPPHEQSNMAGEIVVTPQ
jgi:plastocyanin